MWRGSWSSSDWQRVVQKQWSTPSRSDFWSRASVNLDFFDKIKCQPFSFIQNNFLTSLFFLFFLRDSMTTPQRQTWNGYENNNRIHWNIHVTLPVPVSAWHKRAISCSWMHYHTTRDLWHNPCHVWKKNQSRKKHKDGAQAVTVQYWVGNRYVLYYFDGWGSTVQYSTMQYRPC